MQIGIFGDSYADTNPKKIQNEELERLPWMLWLEKLGGHKVTCYGMSATNIWYSYKKFLNNYTKFDTIIFVYSNANRWLNINEIDGKNIGMTHIVSEKQLLHVNDEYKDVAKLLVKLHPYIYDEQLNLFVYQNVFNSINQLCKKNNIKLINIIPFEENFNDKLRLDISKSHGPVLTGLMQISGYEIKLTNDTKGVAKTIKDYLATNADLRFCHMNLYNNKLLAQTILEIFENPKNHVILHEYMTYSCEAKYMDYILEFL